METKHAAATIAGEVRSLLDDAIMLEKRSLKVFNQLASLPQSPTISAGADGLPDLVRSILQERCHEIVSAVNQQIGMLRNLFEGGDSLDSSDSQYVTLTGITIQISEAANEASQEFGAALQRSVERCGERLSLAGKRVGESVSDWTERLVESAQQLDEIFDGLEQQASSVWQGASDELRDFLAEKRDGLQDRIEDIASRVGSLGERFTNSIDKLSNTQSASALAMAATQGPLELCIGIFEDTRAIFEDI